MDRELFFQWVEVTLIENMKHLGKSLLMLDEYGSHLSVSVIDHCCENDVLSYYSLPHKYFLATGCVCGYVVQRLFFKIDRSHQTCHMSEAYNFQGDVVWDIQTTFFATLC